MSESCVLDASALLALFFAEPRRDEIEAHLLEGGRLILGAVNLSEILMTSARRRPTGHADVVARLRAMPIEIISADVSLAHSAAEAKVRYPVLNFGDCFCYALAKSRGLPILTTDADFSLTDADLVPLRPSGG